jgi:hypothetical protein
MTNCQVRNQILQELSALCCVTAAAHAAFLGDAIQRSLMRMQASGTKSHSTVRTVSMLTRAGARLLHVNRNSVRLR